MQPERPVFGHGFVLALIAIVVGMGASTAGCGKLRAATQPEMPALEAPPPPPRVIAPVQAEAPVTSAEPTIEEQPTLQPPPAAAPARSDGKPAPGVPPRADREREQEAAKTEAAKPEAAKPEESRPSLTLQKGDSRLISERGIRDQLARASVDLQRVNYRSLSPNLKEQYDVAKRFIQQSEEVLKAGNLVYASTLADKAAEIAEVLPR